MVTLPPQPRFIRVARLVAAGLANELGFGVDRLDDVRLAIGEACALAVQVGARDVSADLRARRNVASASPSRPNWVTHG